MSDSHGVLSQYVLSEAESRRIFEEEIAPAELGHLAGASNQGDAADGTKVKGDDDDVKRERRGGRIAMLLVGQTGAGKTRTAPLLLEALSVVAQRRPAHFIADTYKTYHPFYADLVERSPALASPATGPDARRWLAMACALAVERGVDCLVESACRHPADFQDLVRLFGGDSRYRVRVALLAVPEALSRLGILVRYHNALPEARSGRLPLRLTPQKVHDDSYAGLLEAARWLDRETPADQVVVLRRGNRVALHFLNNNSSNNNSSNNNSSNNNSSNNNSSNNNSSNNNSSNNNSSNNNKDDSSQSQSQSQGSPVAAALLRERRRPLDPDELQLAADELGSLEKLVDAGEGDKKLAEQLRQIDELLAEVTPSPPPPPPPQVQSRSSAGGGPEAPPSFLQVTTAAMFPDLQTFDHVAFVASGPGE